MEQPTIEANKLLRKPFIFYIIILMNNKIIYLSVNMLLKLVFIINCFLFFIYIFRLSKKIVDKLLITVNRFLKQNQLFYETKQHI